MFRGIFISRLAFLCINCYRRITPEVKNRQANCRSISGQSRKGKIKMNRKNVNLLLIGGDLRQLTAAEELMHLGYAVSVCGFDTYGGAEYSGGITIPERTHAVLLPVPVFRGEYMNLPFSGEKITRERLANLLRGKVGLVCGGMIPAGLTEELAKSGTAVFDLCESDSFNIMNAVPTAEGAAAVAMGNMTITLCGCNAAVLGFGRVGRALCRLLSAMGAHVTAVSRSERDLAESEACGCIPAEYTALPGLVPAQDVIFNTVPHTVVTEEVLAGMSKGALIVDLASRPGGVDTMAASRLGVRVISALSLPGKAAPVTAGRIIARCLDKRLGEAIL